MSLGLPSPCDTNPICPETCSSLIGSHEGFPSGPLVGDGPGPRRKLCACLLGEGEETTNLAASRGSSEWKYPPLLASQASSMSFSIAAWPGPVSAACSAECASVASLRKVTRHLDRSVRDTRRSPAMYAPSRVRLTNSVTSSSSSCGSAARLPCACGAPARPAPARPRFVRAAAPERASTGSTRACGAARYPARQFGEELFPVHPVRGHDDRW